jgi:hypothetical protein
MEIIPQDILDAAQSRLLVNYYGYGETSVDDALQPFDGSTLYKLDKGQSLRFYVGDELYKHFGNLETLTGARFAGPDKVAEIARENGLEVPVQSELGEGTIVLVYDVYRDGTGWRIAGMVSGDKAYTLTET